MSARRPWRAWTIGAAPLLCAAGAMAALAPPPRTAPAGIEVVATSAVLAPGLRRAARGYERDHPGVRIAVVACGSDFAVARLYTGQADAAVIGRAANDNEIKAYAWIYGHPPVAQPLRSGASVPVAIWVARANPLPALTVAQAHAVLAVTTPAPLWRDLGSGGAFGRREVHLVLPDAESGTGRFVRHVLHDDAAQFDWPRTREIAAPPMTARDDRAMAQAIVAAVARDPQAIGFGPVTRARGVRIVPLRTAAGLVGPGAAGYPLGRTVMSYRHADADAALTGFLATVADNPRDGVSLSSAPRP